MSEGTHGIETASRRIKSTINIGDKETLAKLAKVLDKYEKANQTTPEGFGASMHKNNAATIISSWVLGMSRARCAQRLLDWWCVDTNTEFIDLSAASDASQKRVTGLADRGYEFLRQVEFNRIS